MTTVVHDPSFAPFTSRAGAVGSPPEHYGTHVAEQRALAAGSAVVLLGDRGVVTVTGPDRLTWLDSLMSQSLAKLHPGESAEALLLDPQGRIEHVMRVLDDGETAWLLVDAAAAPALAAWLDRMRFMLRVEVADRSGDFATIGDLGSGVLPHAVGAAVSGAAASGAEPGAEPIALQWRDPWPSVVVGGVQYAAGEAHPAASFPWRETLIERDRLGEFAGIPVAGTLAADALRIAAWRPGFAGEVDERTIPHELDWLRSAVHMNKGCYRGQETVAKVHNLGHPPRRLVMLHVDGSDSVTPAVGDDVVLAGQAAAPSADGAADAAVPASVGRVTSAAIHHELGPIALAVVKRSVDPSVTLEIIHDGVRLAAAQEVIVPPSAGATADVPRLPRLGRR